MMSSRKFHHHLFGLLGIYPSSCPTTHVKCVTSKRLYYSRQTFIITKPLISSSIHMFTAPQLSNESRPKNSHWPEWVRIIAFLRATLLITELITIGRKLFIKLLQQRSCRSSVQYSVAATTKSRMPQLALGTSCVQWDRRPPASMQLHWLPITNSA